MTSPADGRSMPVHLLTSFTNTNGGSENRALALHARLRHRGEALLWSDVAPASGFSGQSIRSLHPYRGEFPHGGTLVIIGAHTRIGPWIASAALHRTIVVANLHPLSILKHLEMLDEYGIHSPEIVYASSALRDEIGLPGRVEASPIDLNHFAPAGGAAARPFSVGRLSRDQTYKHHPDDPALYEMLVESECGVRIMGGTSMSGWLHPDPRIELLAEGEQPAREFLSGLDCFFYRTADNYFEPSGRVVFEAMACGLPVVCGTRGGYAEHLRHGENGFLVDSQEEAYDTIMGLQRDAAMRAEIGRAARLTVEGIYGLIYEEELAGYYLGDR